MIAKSNSSCIYIFKKNHSENVFTKGNYLFHGDCTKCIFLEIKEKWKTYFNLAMFCYERKKEERI